MEFLLNVLFFVVAPGLIILDLIKQVARRKPAGGSDITHDETNNTKKIYSSHDLQVANIHLLLLTPLFDDKYMQVHQRHDGVFKKMSDIPTYTARNCTWISI